MNVKNIILEELYKILKEEEVKPVNPASLPAGTVPAGTRQAYTANNKVFAADTDIIANNGKRYTYGAVGNGFETTDDGIKVTYKIVDDANYGPIRNLQASGVHPKDLEMARMIATKNLADLVNQTLAKTDSQPSPGPASPQPATFAVNDFVSYKKNPSLGVFKVIKLLPDNKMVLKGEKGPEFTVNIQSYQKTTEGK